MNTVHSQRLSPRDRATLSAVRVDCAKLSARRLKTNRTNTSLRAIANSYVPPLRNGPHLEIVFRNNHVIAPPFAGWRTDDDINFVAWLELFEIDPEPAFHAPNYLDVRTPVSVLHSVKRCL